MRRQVFTGLRSTSRTREGKTYVLGLPRPLTELTPARGRATHPEVQGRHDLPQASFGQEGYPPTVAVPIGRA